MRMGREWGDISLLFLIFFKRCPHSQKKSFVLSWLFFLKFVAKVSEKGQDEWNLPLWVLGPVLFLFCLESKWFLGTEKPFAKVFV